MNEETPNKFILTGKKRDLNINPKGVGCALFEGMIDHKDKVAQIDSETGIQDTFGDLLRRVTRTALEMRRRGITSGDMVTICSSNHLNIAVPFMASLLLRAKVSCLDPSLSVVDTTYLLEKVQPKMIFISSNAESLMEEALESCLGCANPQVVTFGHSEKYERFINFLRPSPKEEEEFVPVPATDLKETVVVLFSSGTTGLPKGICLHHYGLLGQANFCSDQSEVKDFTWLSFTSLYWISSISMLIFCTRRGYKRLVVPKYERKVAWDVIKTFKPNVSFMAPYVLLDLVKDGPPIGSEATGLFGIILSGSAVTKDQLTFARKQLPNTLIYQLYGMTEISGGVAVFDMMNPDDVRFFQEKHSSCGKPIGGVSYKVVDPETNETLGPNKRGELRLKSDFLLNGYYNQDSSGAWDEDGWFKTGDVVYYDEDNCFFHVDRIKELLKYKAWHVVPAVLEEVIARHPDVLNVIVVGIPHPEDGDLACGVVVVKENSKVTPEELKKFAEDQLDDRQQLRGGVKFVKEFPLTPTGKVRRVEVRNAVISGQL